MRQVLMVCPGAPVAIRVLIASTWADSRASLADVKRFTEATATWRPVWLEGAGAATGTGPSARSQMNVLAAASKLWVFGGYAMDGKSRHPIKEAGPASDSV